MNNKTLVDPSYRSDLFGTVLKPNDLSYDQLMYEGILKITNDVNNSDFMICLNFVLKYLTKITNIDNFIYFASSHSSDEENNSYNTNLTNGNKINPFDDLVLRFPKKFNYSNKPTSNSIIFYGINPNDINDVSHVGFMVNLFGEDWIISKFGGGDVYLHKILSVPAHYNKPVKYLNVCDNDYHNYFKRIEILLEKQITKFKN